MRENEKADRNKEVGPNKTNNNNARQQNSRGNEGQRKDRAVAEDEEGSPLERLLKIPIQIAEKPIEDFNSVAISHGFPRLPTLSNQLTKLLPSKARDYKGKLRRTGITQMD